MDKGERGNSSYEPCLLKLFLDVEPSSFAAIFTRVACMFRGGYKAAKVLHASKIRDTGSPSF